MISKIKKIIFLIFIFSLFSSFNTISSPYTIANGKDFNTRIKMHLNKNYSSATPDFTITAFKYSATLDGSPIDISEDGDSSVLAYIKNNIIYCVSDDDVYLNEDASYMFDKFVNLKQVDLSFMNFKKTRNTKFMFGNCKYLKDVNFDNDITINLNNIDGMFFDCQSLVDLQLFMFNTKNVKSMNSLFFNCKNLKNIYIDTSKWSVKNVTNFNKTYFNCAMLRTNFNKPVLQIDESQYKTYSIAGDDDKEGLLKDYDFDYDDYGKNTGSFKVDLVSETLVTTPDNKNTIENILSSDVLNSYNKSIVNLSTFSELYQHHSDARIGKNGKMQLSNGLIAQTVDEVPILKEETTFIDKLVPQRKKKSTSSEFKIIIEEETEENFEEVKEIQRPNYISTESLTDADSTNDQKESIDNVNFDINKQHSYLTLIIILIVAIFIITIGIFVFYYKNKQNTDEPWS